MKPGWLIAAVAAVAAAAHWRHRLEWPARVGAGLVALGMAVYGTGVVELPDLARILEDVGRALGPWTYLLVGLMSYLEAAAFVGVMVPGETTIVVGGVVAGQGQIDLIVLIAIAWSMAVLGDLTGYLLGRKLGRPFLVRNGPRFGVSEEVIGQADTFFDRHGGKAIFIGRFIGIVRSLAPFLAGSSKMPLNRFVPYDILGAGLQSTLLCVVGFLFWRSLDRVLEFVERGAFLLGVVIVGGAALVIAVRYLRDPANREALLEWLRQRSRHWWARLALATIERAQGPARFLIARLTPGGFGLEVTTLLALASVGSYVFFGYMIILEPGDLTPGDARGRDWADAIQVGILGTLAELARWLGHLPVVAVATALAGVVLLARRHVLEGMALIWGLALVCIAILVTKGAIWHPEPREWPAAGLIERASAPNGDPSPTYPSAIAAYSVAWVAIALALRHAISRLAGLAFVLVIGILLSVAAALSSVYLGEDWFSDAAGGFGLGVTAFCIAGLFAFWLDWLRAALR